MTQPTITKMKDIEGDEPVLKAVDLDHISYSTCKKINRKGVDYAVGVKLGLITETTGDAAEVGTLVHGFLLGGTPEWIVSPYSDFRKKEAKEWKAAQNKIVIKEEVYKRILKTTEAVLNHPLAKRLIESCDLEAKLDVEIKNIKFVGCADGISTDRKIIFDLKTTEQFDMFKWQALKMDYDLQASVYNLFGNDARYYFIVAETCAPFRVQMYAASREFIESGNKKLERSIEEFVSFRSRQGANDLERLNFNIGETDILEEVEELGDWS